MKKILIILCFLALSCTEKKEISKVVDASCGQCQFGLTSQKGCDLAVKIDGKAYFVDGTNIDDHGDAHNQNDGFCEVVRKAKVTGEVVDGRFVATSFKLVDKK
jgi:hypothetical protein